MHWTPKEYKQLKSLAKRKISFEAISVRLGRSEASVLGKARREGIKLNMAAALPRLTTGGRLEALGEAPVSFAS
jgi:hypothetical protein